jgi:hypothetical protein
MSKTVKIRTNSDIEINGRIYFIPDKYTDDLFISSEYKKLYNIIIALYLESLITNGNISNISKISKNHFAEAVKTADKLVNYLATGKIYIASISPIDKELLDKIPESLTFNINPNIVERIE